MGPAELEEGRDDLRGREEGAREAQEEGAAQALEYTVW